MAVLQNLLPMRRRKSQSSATILIDDIMEHYTCPICFDDIKRGHMTPCGHNFCEGCIRECLNRKHICPLCTSETTADQLIRNHHLDSVVSTLQAAREDSAHKYVANIMQSSIDDSKAEAPHAVVSPIGKIFAKATANTLVKYENYHQAMFRDVTRSQRRQQESLRSQLVELIPMLAHIDKQIRSKQSEQQQPQPQSQPQSLVEAQPGADVNMVDAASSSAAGGGQSSTAVEEHKEGAPTLQPIMEELFYGLFNMEGGNDDDSNVLIATIKASVEKFNAFLKQHSNQLMLNPSRLNEIESKLSIFASQMELIQQRFDRSCKLLFESYESYMTKIEPAPFLLPVSVTIRLRGRRQFWDNIALKPTSNIGSVITIVEENFAKMGDSIEKWNEKSLTLGLIRPLADNKDSQPIELVHNLETCVSEFHLRPATQIHVITTFQLKSEAPRPCFTYHYSKDANLKCDYFRCNDCKFNWVCQPCSIQCHKGHNLVPFMMGHTPSYACCYCVKKRKCVILNIKSKK